MTSTRKEFFKRIAYVGLATIPLIFFWEQEGPERLIAGAVFIFGMYQVIMIVTMSQQIIDDFFPPKTYKDARTKPFDNIVYRLAPGLFFAGLVFEIFEIRRMDNTIGGARFFWMYASLGIVIAVVVTILLKLKSPSIYFESRRRITVHFGLFLGFFLFVPASASFINHALSDSRIDCNKCKIISKSTGGRRNKSSWIFLKINGREERFDVTRTFWNGVNEGGLVVPCTQKGYLGYDFVKEFKTVDQ
jgi:hypothetical protein